MISISLLITAAIAGAALFVQWRLHHAQLAPAKELSYSPRPLNPRSEYIIKLVIKPIKNEYILGADLKKVAELYSWHYGRDKFFHRMLKEDLCYTVCHLFHPGTFAFSRLGEACYSGCFFIFLAHEQPEPLSNYQLFLKEVKDIARILHGVILDEQHTLLNPVTEKFFKEELERWGSQVQVSQKERVRVGLKE